MMIGKPGAAATAISTADAASITVRGRDLCGDLMGRLGFTDYFHLLVTGREPTAEQRFFLDLLLVAIAEHGLVPTNQAARMTLAADPAALQGAVAAGILGCGTVVLGTAEACGSFLTEARARVDAEGDGALVAMVAAIRRDGGKLPGFGHPLHKPVDPRAERIFALADARGVAGVHCRLARATAPAAAEAWGKPLTLNVSMAIAAVLLDIDFPPAMLKAIPILARTASLLAHLAEEQERPIGFLMAAHAEAAIAYDGGAAVTPAAAADDAPLPRAGRLPLRALGLLPRQARRGRLRRRRARSAGSTASPACRSPRRTSCARTVTPEAPIGAHLAAPMAEVVRVYSTSGTTGSPSYIPLTRADLADWIAISSRSYAASGVAAGERIVTTYNAGPFVAGVALEAFARPRPLPDPGRLGPQRAAARRGHPAGARRSSR